MPVQPAKLVVVPFWEIHLHSMEYYMALVALIFNVPLLLWPHYIADMEILKSVSVSLS